MTVKYATVYRRYRDLEEEERELVIQAHLDTYYRYFNHVRICMKDKCEVKERLLTRFLNVQYYLSGRGELQYSTAGDRVHMVRCPHTSSGRGLVPSGTKLCYLHNRQSELAKVQ